MENEYATCQADEYNAEYESSIKQTSLALGAGIVEPVGKATTSARVLQEMTRSLVHTATRPLTNQSLPLPHCTHLALPFPRLHLLASSVSWPSAKRCSAHSMTWSSPSEHPPSQLLCCVALPSTLTTWR